MKLDFVGNNLNAFLKDCITSNRTDLSGLKYMDLLFLGSLNASSILNCLNSKMSFSIFDNSEEDLLLLKSEL